MASLSGDDANSTDLVLEMNVMVNGQWGPYLMCNPINTSNPEGRWKCEWSVDFSEPEGYPEVCQTYNYDAVVGYAFGHVDEIIENSTEAECCTAASQHKTPPILKHAVGWVYNNATRNCSLTYWDYGTPNAIVADANHTYGFWNPPSIQPKECTCDRTFKTVGQEDIRYALRGNNDNTRAGGLWQSFPEKGEC